jgi:HK97 family phage portal protein
MTLRRRLLAVWRVLTIKNLASWDDYWFDPVLRPTASGIDVSHETALGITALWNGIHLIANALAMVPLRLYRRKSGGGNVEAREDRRFRIVNLQPNFWQTSFGWRQMSQGHLLLRGNNYHQKVLRGDGSLDSLVPLHPVRIRVEINGGQIVYVYTKDDGTERRFRREEILHIKGLSGNGIVGYNPVEVMREAFGGIVATDRFSAHFFKNNAQPAGIVRAPKPVSDKEFKRVKDEWRATHSGEGESGTAFLDSGMEYQAIGFNAEDSQLINSRTFNIQEAARILNIPPHKLKEMSRATFSNIEHQGIEWVVDTIQPWATNWEQQLNSDLLTEREQATLFFKFDLKALLRGDSQQRAAYYQARFNMGSLTPNQIREFDDEDPYDGGDRYYVQQNLMPVDSVDDLLAAKTAPQPALPPAQDEEPKRLRAFTPLVRDYANRMVHQTITAARKAAKKNDWVAFRVWVDEYQDESVGLIAQHLVPLAASMAQAAGCPNAILGEAVRDFAVSAAQSIVTESVTALRDALRTTEPDQLEAALDSLLESWRWSRPDAIAEREVVRAESLFIPKQLESVA